MKRFFALVICLAICISALSVLVVIPTFAVSHLERDQGLKMTDYSSKNKGYSSDYYETEKHLDEVPHSFEAWVYLSSSLGGANAGTIIGNHSDKGGGRFAFAIAKNYTPKISFYDRSGASHSATFDGAALITGDWSHVVVVWDSDAEQFRCYVNGELKDTVSCSETCADKCKDGCLGIFSLASASHFPIAVAGDFHYNNSQFFKGALQDVAMYSDVLTAEEIKANYLNGVNAEDENLILYYDIDSTDRGKNIYDLSGNGYHLIYSDAWITEEEMQKIREEKGYADEYEYSMAIIGDPQYSTKLYPATVRKMYQWIADNKDAKNIQYLIGLGDITDQCQEKEWLEATDALKIIENANIEYVFVRGNHDKGYSIEETNKDTIAPELYDELFGSNSFYVGQFEKNGGFYEEGSVVNVYRTLTIDDDNWLIVTLDFQADADVRAWANEILEQYPEHRAIIVTHEYLSAHANPSTYGKTLWQEVASKHENVEMVLCGHVSWDNIEVTQTQGENGNTVTQILIDPQRTDLNLSGVGLVAMFYFSKDGTVIDIEYYSAVKNRYYKHCNQIVVDLKAESEPTPYEWDGVTSIAPEGSGTQSDPYLISSAANLLWMAEAHYVKNAGNEIIAPSSFINPFEGKYFVQTADIDLRGHVLPSIGYYFESDSVAAVFGGSYDGAGYRIRNGKIANPMNTASSSGLFGETLGAKISNLTLKEISIFSLENTGFISGTSRNTVVESCKVSSDCRVKFADEVDVRLNISAIVGKTDKTEILNCKGSAKIFITKADAYVGLIVGFADSGTVIYHSVAEGEVSFDGKTESVGAFAGYVNGDVTVVGCKNKTDFDSYNLGDGAKIHTASAFSKNDDAHKAICSCGCGEEIELSHVLGESGYCQYCEVNITGASVSLGTDISVNYYVDVKDKSLIDGKEIYMQFTFNGNVVKVTEFSEENGEYVFTLGSIGAHELGDSIDAQLFLTDGEESILLDTEMGYSVRKYCISVSKSHSDNESLVQLLDDLLIYGAAAQAHIDYKTDKFITGGLTVSPSDIAPTDADKTSIDGNRNARCKIINKGVSYEGYPQLYLTLYVEDISLAQIKINGKDYDTSKLESTDVANEYLLKVDPFKAYEFNDMVIFELYYDGALAAKLNYGINSYVFFTLSKVSVTEELHQKFALALFRYSDSAKEYFTKTEAEK